MTALDLLIDKAWSIETNDMQEELTATIVAETSSGSMFVFKVPFSNDDEEEAALAFVEKQLIENSCVRYVFIHEALVGLSATSFETEPHTWKKCLSQGPTLREPDEQSRYNPSEDPAFQEKIIAVGVERSTGEILYFMADILTSEGVRSVGERQSFTGFGGRLASLFGDDGSFSQTRH